MPYASHALFFRAFATFCIFTASVSPSHAYTPAAAMTQLITSATRVCQQGGHDDVCSLIPHYKALKSAVIKAERACRLPPVTEWPEKFVDSHPSDGACKLRNAIYQAIKDTRPPWVSDQQLLEVSPASPRFDIGRPATIPGDVQTTVGNAITQLGNAVNSILPKDPSCIQYAGNINYISTVAFLNGTKDELAAAGIHDEATCNSGKHVIAAIAAKYNVLAGGAVEMFGGCTCKGAYK